MFHGSKMWLTAFFLGLACVGPSGTASAQEKKKESNEEKKFLSIFKGKTLELKLQNGKAKYQGELTDEDAVVQKHFYKVFTIKLEAGNTYRIEQRADNDPKFDSFLFLEDAYGKGLDKNDDLAEDNLDSRIVYMPSKSGVYRIVTSTLPPNMTGKFVLEVVPASKAEEKDAALRQRLRHFADSTPAEQKKLVQEITKILQDKGGKLSVADAQMAMQLAFASEDMDIKDTRQICKVLSKTFSAADNPKIANITKQFDSMLKKLAVIGTKIDIAGKTTDGKDFDLAKLKGKVVLVDFWATWCGPCVAEMPNIIKAYEKYHAKGFEVVGVSLDKTDEDIVDFLEKKKLPWSSINVKDSTRLADKYEVESIPYPVLIGRDGRVVSIRARGPQLERLLEKLLDEKK